MTVLAPKLLAVVLASLASTASVAGFASPTGLVSSPRTPYGLHQQSPLFSTASPSSASDASTAASDGDDDESSLTSKGLLKRDRYVATNRFAVRQGKGPKFEKRWATRKSRLATLPGFKYFHLMRRIELNDDGTCVYNEGTDEASSQGNYVSFTVWNKKSSFSAWRKGDAFKEAHGGTSIGAFLSTMVNSAFVLRGPPRPAFYDGLLLQSNTPDTTYDIVDGWRSVDADGETNLPAECFVAQNQFFVPPSNAKAFEQRWAQRESKLKECQGFVAFTMLRRDGQAKGHGTVEMSPDEPTYVSTTIWKDRASFDNWRNGKAFQQAHGTAKPPGKGNTSRDADSATDPPVSLWTQPPKPVFYEGTLVISSLDGA